MLRPTVSRPVCLGMKNPSVAYRQTIEGLLMCGALSDERTGPSFTVAAGLRQRSHFRVRVLWDSWPYSFRLLLRLAELQWKYLTSPPHVTEWVQRQNYVTIDGQSASLSWKKAPIWGLGPDHYYCQTVVGVLMWDGSVVSESQIQQ
jgi:hypothetical protein